MTKKVSRKKPTAVVRSWVVQSNWLIKYLEELRRTPSAHGLKWTHKMIAHYAEKYDGHHANAPKACRKQAREYKRRVDTVRNWSINHAKK